MKQNVFVKHECFGGKAVKAATNTKTSTIKGTMS